MIPSSTYNIAVCVLLCLCGRAFAQEPPPAPALNDTSGPIGTYIYKYMHLLIHVFITICIYNYMFITICIYNYMYSLTHAKI